MYVNEMPRSLNEVRRDAILQQIDAEERRLKSMPASDRRRGEVIRIIRALEDSYDALDDGVAR